MNVMENATLENTTFDNTTFENTTFEHTTFEYTAFENTTFEHPTFEYTTFENTAFEYTTFENTAFENSTIGNITYNNDKENTTVTSYSLSTTAEAFILIYTLILVTGIVGNVIICIVIVKMKTMRTPTNFYLFNLAISDMLFLLTRVSYQLHLLWWGKWSYGFSLNFPYMLTIESPTYATVLTTTAFTVERYFAICHPLWNRYAMQELSRVVKYIIGIWIVCILLALCPSFCISYDYSHPKATLTFTKYVIASSGVVIFILPFSLITVLYVLIGWTLRKYTREKNITSTVSPQDRKAIRMLVAVVIAFFFCWTPFWIIRLSNAFNLVTHKKNPHLYDVLWRSITMITILSTIINPFIYSIMSTKFRDAFQEIFIRSWYDNFLKYMRRRIHPEDSVRTTSTEMSSSSRE